MGKLIIATVGFIGAGVLLFMYTQPTYGQTGAIKAQIAQYDDALDKAHQLEQTKQKLLAQYNAFNPDDVKRLQLLLPDHAGNIDLILQLDSLASRHGLVLTNVNATADKPAAANKVGASDTSKYASMQIHFSTRGTYGDFRSFMQDLEESLRVMDLASLELVPDGTTPGTYSYDVTVRTYWLK